MAELGIFIGGLVMGGVLVAIGGFRVLIYAQTKALDIRDSLDRIKSSLSSHPARIILPEEDPFKDFDVKD